MIRHANAIWSGDLKGGKGTFSVGGDGLQDQLFTFRTRFETDPGTNPEELIAAAHASCFQASSLFQMDWAEARGGSLRSSLPRRRKIIEAM